MNNFHSRTTASPNLRLNDTAVEHLLKLALNAVKQNLKSFTFPLARGRLTLRNPLPILQKCTQSSLSVEPPGAALDDGEQDGTAWAPSCAGIDDESAHWERFQCKRLIGPAASPGTSPLTAIGSSTNVDRCRRLATGLGQTSRTACLVAVNVFAVEGTLVRLHKMPSLRMPRWHVLRLAYGLAVKTMPQRAGPL